MTSLELAQAQSALSETRRRGAIIFAGDAPITRTHRTWARGALQDLTRLALLGAVEPGFHKPRQLAKALHPKEVFFGSRLPNRSGSHDPLPEDAATILGILATTTKDGPAGGPIGSRGRHKAQRWLVKGNIAAAMAMVNDAPDEATRDFALRFAEDWLQEFESADRCILGCIHCEVDQDDQ